jgi:transcriptional regulator with XRE-family HTH domain
MQPEIWDRVLERIGEVCPDRKHRDIADAIGMTPDSFSRALHGKRSFSSIELARLADQLSTDVYWLITGQPDPHRLIVAARHNFNPDTGGRSVPGRDNDAAVLADIALAYKQAFQDGQHQPVLLPKRPSDVEAELGEDFVLPFADRLGSNLGVDVVRVPRLSTAYSFTVVGCSVIVVPATGNWFWENWSIAHEMGHLVNGHHADGLAAHVSDAHESWANWFAAELLLPADKLERTDWKSIDTSSLAAAIWDLGVSTEALERRLANLGIDYGEAVRSWAKQPTQRLLRWHWPSLAEDSDPITERMDTAASRRFPIALQDAHLKKIASGQLGKDTLAWMLGIDAEALEVDAPAEPQPLPADELANALGL